MGPEEGERSTAKHGLSSRTFRHDLNDMTTLDMTIFTCLLFPHQLTLRSLFSFLVIALALFDFPTTHRNGMARCFFYVPSIHEDSTAPPAPRTSVTGSITEPAYGYAEGADCFRRPPPLATLEGWISGSLDSSISRSTTLTSPACLADAERPATLVLLGGHLDSILAI